MPNLSLQVSVDLSGIDRVIGAIRRGGERGVAVIANVWAIQLQKNCPVRTGVTRAHIRSRFYRGPGYSTGIGVVDIAFPALLWYTRNVKRVYPRMREQAFYSWARANAARIVAKEIRRELAALPSSDRMAAERALARMEITA